MSAKDKDIEILELSMRRLSVAFDEFIGKCMDSEDNPIKPTVGALMKARGYMPPYCHTALSKRKEPSEPANPVDTIRKAGGA